MSFDYNNKYGNEDHREETECWKCETKSRADRKKCHACGDLTPNYDRKDDKWNKRLKDYTDQALTNYANKATDDLIKKEYEDANLPMYKILIQNKAPVIKIGRMRQITLGEYDRRTNTLNYFLDTLREKAHTHDNVAHESSHASPETLTAYDKAADQPFYNDYVKAAFIRKEQHRNKTWQEKRKEYLDKLKRLWPQYSYND